VVGAIVAFGVRNQSLGPFDLDVVGWILMLAGGVGLALTLWIWNSRRTRTATTHTTSAASTDVTPPTSGGTVYGPNDRVVEERRTEHHSS
jgi:hypothetical protein